MGQCPSHHADCVCLVETHQLDFGSKAQALKDKGWRSLWSNSRPTSKGGCRGGSCILFPRHLRVSDSCNYTVESRVDWTACKWRRHAVEFLLITLYLTDGIRFAGENIGKLSSLGSMLRQHTCPFVIMADWNAPPQALVNSGWPEQVGARPLVPTDAEITCRGRGGSLIDYCLISHSMEPYVQSCELDLQSPWAPHSGILLTLKARPHHIMVDSILRPRRLQTVLEDAEGKHHRLAIGQQLWELARDAPVEPMAATPAAVANSLAYQISPSASDALASRLHRWSNASESCLKQALGLPPSKPQRCTWPKFQKTKVGPCLDGKNWHGSSVSQAVRVIGASLARVHEYLLLLVRDRGAKQRAQACQWCTSLSWPADLQAACPGLLQRLHQLGQSSLPELRDLKESLDSTLERLTADMRDQARTYFAAWVTECARTSAGALHRWSKQDTEPKGWCFETHRPDHILGPGERVRARAEWWSRRWGRDARSQQLIVQTVQQLRRPP